MIHAAVPIFWKGRPRVFGIAAVDHGAGLLVIHRIALSGVGLPRERWRWLDWERLPLLLVMEITSRASKLLASNVLHPWEQAPSAPKA